MNIDEAKSLVLKELSKDESLNLMILEDETIEKSWGWVFFYQTKEYVETGDFRFMLGGNAPYIVNRNTGQITETGTAYEIEHYIAEYEQDLKV
ncbi:YrhB domain-containing protein [Neptunomonas sp.]|uniref:YrhB domain-containing protein n=1 Tax=Neptunomonas sp. TaxID=1971898 RepID=UPI0025F06AFC|nr:YrhB domain-containing protein [Neptunomonas sp.]